MYERRKALLLQKPPVFIGGFCDLQTPCLLGEIIKAEVLQLRLILQFLLAPASDKLS